MTHKLTTPLTGEDIAPLRAGDEVRITGVIYTGRDAAHKKLFELLEKVESLPVDLRNQLIYYTGPAPTPPGRAIGSCGPTTAYRMDAYTPALLAYGMRGMIGKGRRGQAVIDAIREYGCVYLAAEGGCGALLANYVKKCDVVAFPELGTEAIHRLEVEDFPVTVFCDSLGNISSPYL